MRRALRCATMGTPVIFFSGLAVLLSVSALAWGAWGVGAGITPAGLMSVEASAARAVVPTPGLVEITSETADEPASPGELVEPQAVFEPKVVSNVGQATTFDGRRLRPVKQLDMKVTAYSPDERSCGVWADGWTASGYSVWTNGMRLVAADTSMLPFGTIVTIPGYNNGEPVQVLDIGGAIKGNRLDVLYPTHERALQWGVQQLEVTVWEYAD